MRLRLLSQLARFLGTEHKVRQSLRRQNPTLQIAGSTELRVDGELTLGSDVVVSERAKLVVPPSTRLVLGDQTYIGRDVELGAGACVELGRRVSLQDRCVIVGDVNIGSYCLFSLNVLVSSGRHYHRHSPHLLIRDQDRDVLSTPEGRAAHSGAVHIGEDCWLGVNTVVMPGVRIGRGAVVGANSVVTHDIPPYCVVAGAPAKLIGKRLDFVPPDQITWDDLTHIPYFYAGFDVATDQRDSHRCHGGLIARGAFDIWLKHRGTALHLRVRSMGQGMAYLTNRNESWEIPDDEWVDIEVPHAPGPTHFELRGRSVAVAEAWTA